METMYTIQTAFSAQMSKFFGPMQLFRRADIVRNCGTTLAGIALAGAIALAGTPLSVSLRFENGIIQH